MISKVFSSTLCGLHGACVEVEIDISRGLPVFSIVGLPDTAVKESRDRVRSATKNSGYEFPVKKVIVNLSPADLKKEGALFDLPIAIGILAASGRISNESLEGTMIIGELSLDGALRGGRATLSHVMQARQAGMRRIILPVSNAQEAALVSGIDIYGAVTLVEAVEFLSGELNLDRAVPQPVSGCETGRLQLDYSDISGQEHARRAIEIAAAGGHNILMVGPPGSGKTMLAKRMPTILPPLTADEALETTAIFSVMDALPPDAPLVIDRPFRAPHHSISDAGLVGGGSQPRPGEVTLANNGVLFLDELAEFSKRKLDMLRQPLEDGSVTISRASGALTFPARFMLVSAMNPCPCGYLSDTERECRCSSNQVERYLSRISGPLLDRIDLHIEVPAVRFQELSNKDNASNETSAAIRQRVLMARKIQSDRYAGKDISLNSRLHSGIIKEYCTLDKNSLVILERAMSKLGLSARSYNKILAISRTIADLDESINIDRRHLMETLQYRAKVNEF